MAATKTDPKRPPGGELKPLRVKFTQAMKLLSVSRTTLERLIARGVLSAQYPNGTSGRGKRIYLPYAEVELYGEKGEDAVREYRARNEQAQKAAKGKGRK